MSYNAIVFDLDGVLLSGYHTAPAVYRQATSEALADFGAAVEEPPADLVDPDGTAAIREACDRLDIPAEPFWAYREHAATALENDRIEAGDREPFADVETLETLDTAADLGIVSNNRHGTVRFVCEYFDWGTSIEAAVGRAPTVAGYDRMKPDPFYLQQCLDTLDCAPDETLFVGDRRSDVATADRIGADSALLIRDGDRPDGGPEPTIEIESLTALQ